MSHLNSRKSQAKAKAIESQAFTLYAAVSGLFLIAAIIAKAL